MLVWGSGYLATKIGIQYAAPFTFLSLRYPNFRSSKSIEVTSGLDGRMILRRVL